MEQKTKNLKFIWAGDRTAPNQELYFTCKKKVEEGTLILFAADFYQVRVNGKFLSYGPERAVEGYARMREIALTNVEELEIRVISYNVSTYCCDRQLPFFAARVLNGEEILLESDDFVCTRKNERNKNVPRYSYQRGYLEAYDLRNVTEEVLEPFSVEAPILLGGLGDTAKYERVDFLFDSKQIFQGFAEVVENVWWANRENYQRKEGEFDTVQEVAKNTIGIFEEYNYHLQRQAAGFIQLSGYAEEEITVYAAFDEYVQDGKWKFRRSSCNDVVVWTLPKGKFEVMSFEPYAFKFLKLLVKGKGKITPSVVTLQNDREAAVEMQGENEITRIFNAAVTSFRHNAVDVYSDCPSRERAGWLFDSRFTALTEELLFKNRDIERTFLENYILGDAPELNRKGMLPDCFPAQHDSGEFIPNYAMWYVIEVGEYYQATKDERLLAEAKGKAYGLYEYFKPFENEEGLLEDLEGWIFVEWSDANSSEFVSGVNFPSNMTYALMLDWMGRLYNDQVLIEKAQAIRKKIKELAFNGTFFVDNATRENGKLIRRDDHISETCQYYSVITGMDVDEAFIHRLIQDFGPFREGKYPDVVRSNVLPGFYIRFLWLCDIGENDRAIKESIKCFKEKAEYSGTLWENEKPTDSLDHGFASCAAVILVRALTGFRRYENGKAVCEKKAEENYGVKVIFS